MNAFQYLAPIAPFEFEAPDSVQELLALLRDEGRGARLVAGGTDLMIGLKERLLQPKVVIDMSRLRPELAGVYLEEGLLHIGALTTFSELEADPLVARHATALGVAASQVGTLQIRNRGTIGGNLANASPAADAAPPLIALSALVRIRSSRGQRAVPVERFFTGVKTSGLLPDEVITSVELPVEDEARSWWARFARRNENVISVVSVAARAELNSGRFERCRISLGAVAPTPILATMASDALSGKSADGATIENAAKMASLESRPISDVRAGAEYRRHLVYVLTKRVLSKLVGRGS
ncbi:MAG TPA: xanthine dehydrogenase family protein subunit M [Nitrososphaerales archaeon]|nr:xanthine dehydrogenase family protein subunit M [Nitrososphaerales archaeon]